jgi:protein phosphatase
MTDLSDTQEVPVLQPAEGLGTPVSASASVRVDFGAASNVGKVRKNNEDHFFIGRLGRSMVTLLANLPDGLVPQQFEEAGYVFIVADGMGGAAAGEVASALAIASAMNMALRSPKWSLRIDENEARDLVEQAKAYFEHIHKTVGEKAKSDQALAGMGTTMTSAWSVGFDLFTFHVGDSRAYLLHDGRLEQLTRDQTVAQLLADAGHLTPKEAGKSGMSHVLTSAVGAGKEEIVPEIRQFRVADGDRLLLCTDGLTDMVEDARIAEVLKRFDAPGDACAALIDLALDGGGKDNVTAVVARYRGVTAA